MFKSFESGIFSKLKDNPKQAEESKQFSNYNKHVLLESDNNSNTSNGTWNIIFQVTQMLHCLHQKTPNKRENSAKY